MRDWACATQQVNVRAPPSHEHAQAGGRRAAHPFVVKALVTGGAGFIGSHVVDRLLADGHRVRVFDTRAGDDRPRRHCERVVGDLLDPRDLASAAHGCDVIIHLAAAADVGLVAKDPAGSEALNSRGTLNVLEAARSTGARVLYASTIWVYSDVRAAEVDEDSELGLPSHLYTATKLAGEMYCRSYGELYGVESTILRFGIPYGPRARPAAVLPIFVNKALAGEPLTIAGDGLQTRRFVYVEDLAEGVVNALRPQAAGRIYNLVGEEETSVRDIADAVRAAVGEVEIVHTEGRAGDFAGARISGERAAEELGWRPRTPFAEGVGRYVEWHREDAGRRELSTAAPAAAGAAAPRRRARERLARLVGPHAQSAISGVLALVVYGFILHATGLLDDELHTVVVGAVLAVAATVTIRTTKARVAVWLTALAGAALLVPPEPTGVLDMHQLTPALLALSIAGAGFVLLAASGGRRVTLEPAEQGER
jgi:UDP-glucose 4-epimerase